MGLPTAFLASCGALDLTTRPVLVLVIATGAFSSTAGACYIVSESEVRYDWKTLTAVGALVLRALPVFALAAVVLVLVAVFFGAAAFLVVALVAAAFLAGAFFSLAAVVFFSFGALFAAGLAAAASAGFASFTGPEAPFGRAKTPLSEPLLRARLKRLLNWASGTLSSLLLARTYFLSA